MALCVFNCFSILLLTVISVQIGRNLAIQIEINPETYDQLTQESVTIKCTLEGDNNVAKKIMLMEILKDDKPIVVKHRGLQPSFPNGNEKRFVTTGHISLNGSISHLSLTLGSYKSGDSGQYSCVTYFVDETGQVKIEKSSKNLTEEPLDVKALQNLLNFMKNKIVKLEEKTNVLEEKTKNQSQEMTSLKDKVGYTVAFSATNSNDLSSRAGQVLIFPDMITQVGQGYDVKTGVFTAPRHGVYAFHLVVTEYSSTCGLFDVILKVNNKRLAVLVTYSNVHPYDQSSVSTVVELKAGDRVFSVSVDNSCTVYNLVYSAFTGYLIQAM